MTLAKLSIGTGKNIYKKAQFEKAKYYESGVSTGKILGILLDQGYMTHLRK